MWSVLLMPLWRLAPICWNGAGLIGCRKLSLGDAVVVAVHKPSPQARKVKKGHRRNTGLPQTVDVMFAHRATHGIRYTRCVNDGVSVFLIDRRSTRLTPI